MGAARSHYESRGRIRRRRNKYVRKPHRSHPPDFPPRDWRRVALSDSLGRGERARTRTCDWLSDDGSQCDWRLWRRILSVSRACSLGGRAQSECASGFERHFAARADGPVSAVERRAQNRLARSVGSLGCGCVQERDRQRHRHSANDCDHEGAVVTPRSARCDPAGTVEDRRRDRARERRCRGDEGGDRSGLAFAGSRGAVWRERRALAAYAV